jgi:hypothetical protein
MGDSVEIEIGGRRYEVSGSVGGTGIPTRPMTVDELKAAIGRGGVIDYTRPIVKDLENYWGWIKVIGPIDLPEAMPDESGGTSEPTKVETWRDLPPLL